MTLQQSLMSWWSTTAMCRRSWSMDWHGSGRFVETSLSVLLFKKENLSIYFLHIFLPNSEWLYHKFSSHKPPCPTYVSLQDVQLKVKAYILGTDMSNFKYDDFIVVLDVISRYRGASSFLVSYKYLHYFSISDIFLSFSPSWSTFSCSCFTSLL